MGLLYKQLAKQVGQNKVFILFLFLLTGLTSLSFFFVMFSVDGNMAIQKRSTSGRCTAVSFL
ncbi:hypothetical protein DWX41_07740 [Hungatella hathewayi]|uniref:Uncharacterized protein n=1 Tax=Hungatella hathewayi TaxID=154046 RepID=A0A3E2WXS9_9FIRM|nr:hypothetical protein DWX41_07740 [Hungatella hathewayi]